MPGDLLHKEPIKADLFDGTLNGYQQAATATAIYPGQHSFWGLQYAALKGCGEAGELAEKVGKLMRDNGVTPTDDILEVEMKAPGARESLIKELGDILWYCAAKANELHCTLEEAARMNIEKLQDRQRRGTLAGSGDNR